MIGPHRVDLVLPRKRDEFGDLLPDEDQPDDVVVEGCLVYPRTSDEADGTYERTVVTGMTLLAPAGTVITAEMKIRHKGREYGVVGDPGEWDYLDGDGASVQVALERSAG